MHETWSELAHWGAKRLPSGERAMIPIVGAGLNAAAKADLSWQGLLELCQKELGFGVPMPKQVAGNTTLVWEAMVLEHAKRIRDKPSVAENQLLRETARLLSEKYRPTVVTTPFYRRFLALGFADVLSFNFDPGLHVSDVQWSHLKGDFTKASSYASLPELRTRLWYPHGFIDWPTHLQLGMRNYGRYIAPLEEARKGHKRHENSMKAQLLPDAFRDGAEIRSLTPEERERLWYAMRPVTTSWLSSAMNAPLVFLGMSLGREEWPLWWFLNQRARNHARRGIDVPVFALLRRPVDESLQDAAKLLGMRLLLCDEFEEGWQRFFGALQAS